jgi:hypothetical protein
MNKVKYYIKILIFSISILGFLDLLINPKPIGFLNSNLNLLTSLLTIFALTTLTAKEILKTRFKISEMVLKGIKIVLLFLFLIYLYVFLKQFNFEQNVEYIIVFYHTLPIIYILNDLITEKVKSKYLAILGIILLIPTLIYFGFIYESYEAYSEDGTPMIFVHQRIRNWICYVGITLILTSIIRNITNDNTV